MASWKHPREQEVRSLAQQLDVPWSGLHFTRAKDGAWGKAAFCRSGFLLGRPIFGGYVNFWGCNLWDWKKLCGMDFGVEYEEQSLKFPPKKTFSQKNDLLKVPDEERNRQVLPLWCLGRWRGHLWELMILSHARCLFGNVGKDKACHVMTMWPHVPPNASFPALVGGW